ncbi:hypothetical protein MKX03_026555 [Papaver bracteatum]|nr:hypothetical protein MKX03_026555 [Papaver bracteatum]
MSAPLRKMGPQIRDLGTKFISARNVRSKVDTFKEVPKKGGKELYEHAKYFAMGCLVGLGVIVWTDYATHGRVVHILGISISKNA